MAARPLGAYVFNGREQVPAAPKTNKAMVEELVHTGALRSKECIQAFLAVDRRHFWAADDASEQVYGDWPLRRGILHLSAPQIYGEALESMMPLAQGMSFLAVGSGTGYFNSVVSELIGDLSTNHGIDISPEAVVHSLNRCGELGKSGISFTVGNVYNLDVKETMRYDRIYIGACANPRSKYLYQLLEVGGVLIGPFQVGRRQQLRRVVRRTVSEFSFEVLDAVHFAPLVEPARTEATSSRSRGPERSGFQFCPEERDGPRRPAASHLQGVPQTFALRERVWSLVRNQLYPSAFRQAVAVLRRAGGTIRGRGLPSEIWTQHVLPFCSRGWFEDSGGFSGPTLEGSADIAPTLVEVCPQGHRHSLGAEDDPDDLAQDASPRLVFAQALRLLAPTQAGEAESEFEYEDFEGFSDDDGEEAGSWLSEEQEMP